MVMSGLLDLTPYGYQETRVAHARHRQTTGVGGAGVTSARLRRAVRSHAGAIDLCEVGKHLIP